MNYNPSRELVGGNSNNQIGGDLRSLNSKATPPVLQKAVVIEVIADPFSLSKEEIEQLAKTVDNPELVSVMPINSVIAQIISEGAGQMGKQNTILFPIFSSHIMLPIKVGETIFVLYEDYSGKGTKIGYWFTRISSQQTVEDANYTHHDRRFDPTSSPDNYKTQDKLSLKENPKIPGFPNGANTPETFSLKNKETDVNKKQDAFDLIKNTSKTYNLTTREPVPRIRKRPGDLVIQGSNNAALILGEDRTNSITNKDNKDYKGQSGTAHLVVGRGRKIASENTQPNKTKKTKTSARVVTNSKKELETDKAPYTRGFENTNNPEEGDPDFENDAAFHYVSMQTNGDENLKVSLHPKSPLKLPDSPRINPSKVNSFGKSFAISKADHIRMVARKDGEEGVAGSVLLIREGQPDQDLGYFFIDDQGKIQIESKEINFGNPKDKKNPVLLFENYQETIELLQKQIDTLTSEVEKAFGSATGNLGAPIPSMFGVGRNNVITGLNADSKNRISEITKADQHSKKIFRENDINFIKK
jgi:hypothetical protein